MARKDADKGAKARKAQLMAAALEYKAAGATERFIADRLEISPATAHRYVAQALAEAKERSKQSVDAMVTLEGERLDRARFAIAPQVFKGSLEAVREWRTLSESYRKLHGLDAPEKRALTDPTGTQMWQPFDAKMLSKLSAEQLEQFEALMELLTAGDKAAAEGGDDSNEDDE